MRLFGRRCPTVTTLELLGGSVWTGQFGLFCGGESLMLPHVTSLNTLRTSRVSFSAGLARIYRLLLNPTLTRLDVGSPWFRSAHDWALRHPLTSNHTPPPTDPADAADTPHCEAQTPGQLRSVHLEHGCDGSGIQWLEKFLAAAPLVSLLCASPGPSDAAAAPHRRSTAFRSKQMKALARRIAAGMSLDRVKLV